MHTGPPGGGPVKHAGSYEPFSTSLRLPPSANFGTSLSPAPPIATCSSPTRRFTSSSAWCAVTSLRRARALTLEGLGYGVEGLLAGLRPRALSSRRPSSIEIASRAVATSARSLVRSRVGQVLDDILGHGDTLFAHIVLPHATGLRRASQVFGLSGQSWRYMRRSRPSSWAMMPVTRPPTPERRTLPTARSRRCRCPADNRFRCLPAVGIGRGMLPPGASASPEPRGASEMAASATARGSYDGSYEPEASCSARSAAAFGAARHAEDAHGHGDFRVHRVVRAAELLRSALKSRRNGRGAGRRAGFP